MPYLQRSKIILQSKRFIILSLVFIIVYVLITTKWITYESKLDENTTQITGNIISYTIDGNKLNDKSTFETDIKIYKEFINPDVEPVILGNWNFNITLDEEKIINEPYYYDKENTI